MRGARAGRRRAAALAFAGLIAAASTALGDGRTGRIEGMVYDDMGEPLAGATVIARSPTQIGGTLRTRTGPDGTFRFLGLMPGVFRVEVRHPRFKPAVRAGVRVHVNQTATLDILLEPKPAAPAATKGKTKGARAPAAAADRGERKDRGPVRGKTETFVITARPVVDVTRATTGDTLSDEYLESVPLLGRSFQGVAGLTGGVVLRRNPAGGAGGNPAISGGTYFNNTYTVDGMDATDPVTHTFGTNFNFDAMADVQVMTGAKGPEFSDTIGGNINIVTRSGSNRLEFDASVYYQDDALTIRDFNESDAAFRNLDVNLNVGGPFIRDRLWYFTSFEFNHSVRSIPPDPDGLLPDHPPRRYIGVKWLGKVTWQLAPRHRIVFKAQTSPASISNTLQSLTVQPEAEAHQNQFNLVTNVSWKWNPTDTLFLQNMVGVTWIGLRVFPESGNDTLSAVRDSGSGVASRNYHRDIVDDRYRIVLESSATRFFNRAFGDHEVKAGIKYHYLLNPSSERIIGNEVITNRFGQPYQRTSYWLDFDERTSCDPSAAGYDPSRCSQGTLETTVSGNKLLVFLQDTWRLPGYKRLRLIPGAALHYGNTINPDGNEVTSFVTGTAHLNFAWDVFGNGKTVVRGGYNQYVDMGFLSLARFIGRDLVSLRCERDASQAVPVYDQRCRVGGLTRTVGYPQGPTYDADGNPVDTFNPSFLTVPRVHEITFGVEREWFPGFSTGVDFMGRWFVNQWEDVETNVIWNEKGDNAQAFRNNKAEFIYDLETPEDARRRYLGVTLFAKKFIGNWQVNASYTYSRNEGTVAEGFATVYLDRAQQVHFYDGFLPDDRPHIVKVAGWYRWRNILTVGGSFWLGAGTPVNRYFFNSFFATYDDLRGTRGTDPRRLDTTEDDTQQRTPVRYLLSLRVSYRLDSLLKHFIGQRHRIELIGEVFNAFNARPAIQLEERNILHSRTTYYGKVLNRQDPFRVRFGLRYRY